MNKSTHEHIISTLFWYSFFEASLIKLLVLSIVCKCVILLDKYVDVKLDYWNDWKIITLKERKEKKKASCNEANEASIYIKFRITVTLIKWNQ